MISVISSQRWRSDAGWVLSSDVPGHRMGGADRGAPRRGAHRETSPTLGSDRQAVFNLGLAGASTVGLVGGRTHPVLDVKEGA